MAVEKLPALTVARLAERDGRRCIAHGCVDGLSVQHRAVKGLGGRRTAERWSNGIILCADLNVALEADPGVAAWGRRLGYKVSTHADPSKVPVYDGVTGEWWLLDDNGHKVRCEPPDDVA